MMSILNGCLILSICEKSVNFSRRSRLEKLGLLDAQTEKDCLGAAEVIK